MNLEKWYEKQREVDGLIAEKQGGIEVLSDYRSVAHRTFAFQCELMELANEIGFFKDWKHSHEIDLDKALEELSDNLAFVLSVGITKGYDRIIKEVDPFPLWEEYSYLDLFQMLRQNELGTVGNYQLALSLLLGIGLKLDKKVNVTIINAWYMYKADKNITRQKEGY